jgi:CRP-like cAMP-binding protein
MNDLIFQTVNGFVEIDFNEWEAFSKHFQFRKYKKHDWLLKSGDMSNDIYFINDGIVRVTIADSEGVEDTIDFASEGQFIADYASYLRQTKSNYGIQALSDVEIIVWSRSAVDWGYLHLSMGEQLGRRLAECYFLNHDDRIKAMYTLTSAERFAQIETSFPGILTRVPQHMIASFLGVSPVHLSRLKKNK